MKVPADPNIERLAVDLFNAAVRVGNGVLFDRDDGERVRLKTRSRAQLVAGRTARVKLAGIGWVPLERVLVDAEAMHRRRSSC